MATERDIEIVEDNDAIVVFVCKVDGTPVNLTGSTVELIIKVDKATEEDAPGVIKYSSETGEVILRVQSGDTMGQCQVTFNRADVATPGKLRYRFDVTTNDKKLTYAFGRVIVVDV